MLKEVRESMDRATDMGMLPKEAEYPFAELIVCMGNNIFTWFVRTDSLFLQGFC